MSFDPNVAVTVTLGAIAPSTSALSRPLLLVDGATNSLNGNRTVRYANYAAAKVAQGLGYISENTLLGVYTAINQINVPAQGVLVGRVDTGEDYGEALLACTADDSDFYLIVIDSRDDADIVTVSDVVETMNSKTAAADAGYPFKYCFFSFQSSDSGLLTGALGGLSTLATRDYTNGSYYSNDALWFDAAHQGPLSADLSSVAPTWTYFPAKQVVADVLTVAQTEALDSIHIDSAQSMGTTTNGRCVMCPGQTMSGRQISEVVTAAWLAINLQIAIANTLVTQAANNSKVTVDAAGQQAIVATIQGVINTALNAGSVRETDDDGNPGYVITALPISDADRVAKLLRFTVAVLLPQATQYVNVEITTSTTSVV